MTGSDSLNARALLGWMQERDAIRFLLDDCEFMPTISADDATRLWQNARHSVRRLPRSTSFNHPSEERLNSADHKTIQEFRRKYSRATDILEFLKINPMEMIVHQLFVVTDVKDSVQRAVAGEGWRRAALLDVPNSAPVKWRVESDQIVFELPHGEFFLSAPRPGDTRLQLLQNPAFASVSRFGSRLLLANGYHRAFARSLLSPGEPLLFACSEQSPLRHSSETAELWDGLLGSRPPTFADFFDDTVYVPVRMRRKRGYEMRVRVEMTSVYEVMPAAAAGSAAI